MFVDDEGTYLLDDGREDGGNHEDAEDDVLHALLRAVAVPEGKSDEESRSDTQQELGPDVAGHAPVLLEDTVGDVVNLGHEGHGELVGSANFVVTGGGLALFLAVDTVEFVLNGLGLRACFPHLVPVLRRLSTGTCANDLEHISESGISTCSVEVSIKALTLLDSHHHRTSWRHCVRSSPEESSSSVQCFRSTQFYRPWQGRADDQILGRG